VYLFVEVSSERSSFQIIDPLVPRQKRRTFGA
jgi:hypothetical protein